MIPVPEVNLDPRTEQAGSPTNLAEALYGQFHNLPEAEQQAVGLRFVAEMTTEEAAQIMRITESSFLVCISRAMARLSDLAADKGAA